MEKMTINGTTYTITGEAYIEYRSHINGMTCTSPNNWVAMPLEDENGNQYTAWYWCDEDQELDTIDYDEPEDITDEYGKIVYEK